MMIEWIRLTSDEIESLDRKLPIIIPLGLIEAHGHHLNLGLDNETADYFSRRIAEETGAILAPTIYYGFADAMREYPGTIGVSADTLCQVIRDIAGMFCQQGFKKQIYLSGHGANKLACELAFYKVWECFPDLKPAYWNYWSEAGFTKIHHADKGETEIAMGIGATVHMDKARDYSFEKPWHLINSRYQYQPESGGVNGYPTTADPVEGKRMCEEIVVRLSEKVREAIKN